MNDRPKILIVDDEPYNVEYLVQELEDLNYTTVTAFNGQEALEVAAAESLDLILLDVMMPRMDGFEVLTRLKADPVRRHIPVIIISAAHDMNNVVRGVSLGADDYLPKPFEPVLLQARISSSLEKKRLRDQEQRYLQSLERELEIGRRIQAGFLPETIPQPPGWEIAAYFAAAREVAGDFYDVFPIDADRLALLVGDVADKGVGAALYMSLFRTLLRAVACLDTFVQQPANHPNWLSPMALLQKSVSLTNEYIATVHSESSMFATLFFGVLNPKSGALCYINAGHEPALIFNLDGEPAYLTGTGPAVGLIAGMEYRVAEAYLAPGDTLFVYSDGIPDAQNACQEFFNENQSLASLVTGGTHSAHLLVEYVVAKLADFVGQAQQFDDITMLAVHRAN